MRLALFEPDIPANTGTILRLAACLRIPVDIIQPAGFDMSERALRRAGLDYLACAQVHRHASFEAFEAQRAALASRLVLLTTAASTRYTDFAFSANDTLLVGREAPGCRSACTRPRTHACAFPLHPACARSTSRWRRRWCSARRCARLRDFPASLARRRSGCARRGPRLVHGQKASRC